MLKELKVKGVNFRGTLAALERRSGKETVARVLAKVQGPAKDALASGEVIANCWYPASWHDALLEAIEKEHPAQLGIVRDLARDAVTADFSTLFKVVSLVVSPESALRNSMRIASRYVDGGKIEVVEARDGHVHFRFEEFYGFTRRMWEDWVGGMEAILDLMKVRRLAMRVISGGGDGDERFELVMRYAKPE